MDEEWKPVVGFEPYEVSNLGRVRRVLHVVLKPAHGKGGYPRVRIRPVGGTKPKNLFIHRLVARAFIGECPPGYQVNHLDGDKTNAKPDNLEYVTCKENHAHAWNVLKRQSTKKGQRNHFAKLTDTDAVQIRRLRDEGLTYKAIAAQFNTKPANVWHICSGKTWKHLL